MNLSHYPKCGRCFCPQVPQDIETSPLPVCRCFGLHPAYKILPTKNDGARPVPTLTEDMVRRIVREELAKLLPKEPT